MEYSNAILEDTVIRNAHSPVFFESELSLAHSGVGICILEVLILAEFAEQGKEYVQ